MLWKRKSTDGIAVEQIAPARAVQQQFWLLQQMVADVGVANIAATLSWHGPLDLLVLQEALLDLVRRHVYLRTTVEYADRALQQMTHEPQAIPIELVDLRDIRLPDRAEQVAAEMAEASETPIPVDSMPWIRAKVVRAEDQQFEIALVVSHLICDGLSMGILCAELMQAYAARLKGNPPEWNHPSPAELEPRNALTVSAPTREVAAIELPYDHPRPAAPSYRGGRLDLALTEDETKALVALSRSQRVSPFVTWLSLMHAVAYRYARQSVMEIEIPMSGRDRSLRRAVGPYLQSATLCLTADEETRFSDLLADNAAQVDSMEESITHTAARRAQLLIDYQTALDEVPLTDDITVKPGEMSNGAAIAELRLGIRRRRRHFELQVDYDADLFSPATASRFVGHVRQVLSEVSADPDSRLGDLTLLTNAERHLLEQINRTERGYDVAQFVDSLFATRAQQSSDAIALVHADDQLSYAELDERSAAIAQQLTARGVGHGDRVAMLVDRGIDAVALMFGVMRCGAAFVPIDPEYPKQRQALVLSKAAAKCAVTSGAYADRISSDVPCILLEEFAKRPQSDSSVGVTPTDRSPEDVAYVLFTSGSTGTPKGVQVTHRNLVNFFVGMDELQSTEEPGCWLALTSISFDISMFELLWTMTRGYRVVIEDDPLGIRSGDSEALARTIQQHAVTHVQCTPAMMQAILTESANRAALATLHSVFVGGDVMPSALAEDLEQLVAGDVYNMYGPTETTIWSTAWKLNGDSRNVSIGKPLANTHIAILDEVGRQVAPGVTGELYIGGDGVSAGYFRDPVKTSERFVQVESEGRMFRTGDLVRMRPDGCMQFLGRGDHQIKFNGHRLELGEIETLLRRHEAIAEAVAVLREAAGETKKIVAFVRSSVEEARWPSILETLESTLQSQLPTYMLPSAIYRVEQMPLTPARKVDRKRLMTSRLDDLADLGITACPAQDHTRKAPPASDEVQTQLAQRIRDVVCDELQLAELPADADLASLGVNSLEVVRLADRVDREFGVRPPIALFFRSASVEAAIQAALEQARIKVVPATPDPSGELQAPRDQMTDNGSAGASPSRMGPGVADALRDSMIQNDLSARLSIAKGTGSAMDRLAVVSESYREAYADQTLHPYARYVDPIKSELLARAGLDKAYVRGEGCYVYDGDGQGYLDFVAQYGALPFGYNPPEMWAALDHIRTSQLPNLATNSLLESAGKLAGRLLEMLPEMRHVVFANSGAECTEIAIKLCRSATGRADILSTRKAFHGLTTGALGATGSDTFREGFIAENGGFHHVPYGDADALREMLESRRDEIAAFFVEPIQGESGIIVPPPGYLAACRRLCNEFGVLLVVDEVQTGLGRTGAMFACEQENVAADVMLIAKALGGGLIPVGAVLCKSAAYSNRFGLRHSSTFAGNAMACQVGMASLDKLQEQDQALVQQVAACGAHLQAGLSALQTKYPELVKEVRGRGYMQAIEFDFSALDERPGLMGFLAEQQVLIYLIASHLLHVHHVRVAPSFVGRNVIRLEPPLIAGRKECDKLVAALDATLGLIEAGNTAVLLAPMAGACPKEILESTGRDGLLQAYDNTLFDSTSDQPVDATFGFLVHLSSLEDLIEYDCSLAAFTHAQLSELKRQLVRSADPFLIGSVDVTSDTGKRVRGQFVMVPYTPEELAEMAPDEALQQVTTAAEVARDAGADLIGLGGFTSIVSLGGVALPQDELPPITSGNSFTVAASLLALDATCQAREFELAGSTVAVVGATGQTGRALAVMLAERVGRLILVGRAAANGSAEKRLREVAAAAVDHLCQRVSDEQLSSDGLLSDACDLGAGGREQLLDKMLESGRILLSTNPEDLAAAEVIVTASSATQAFIDSSHLREDAMVIDASRPANVSEAVRAHRPDVTWVEGGIVQVPGDPNLGLFAGPATSRTFACVAEAMLWAMDASVRTTTAEVVLSPERIRRLAELAELHGFQIVTAATAESA